MSAALGSFGVEEKGDEIISGINIKNLLESSNQY